MPLLVTLALIATYFVILIYVLQLMARLVRAVERIAALFERSAPPSGLLEQ